MENKVKNIQEYVSDGTKGFKGVYRFTKAKLVKPEHFALNDEIVAVRDEAGKVATEMRKARVKGDFKLQTMLGETYKTLSEEVQGLIRQLHRVCELEVQVVENLIPTVGRTLIANNLFDATPTNSMLVNKAELGSDGTTPVNGDTSLGTPVYRNDIASITNGNNIGYATAFFAATEVTGTFAEAGLYCDGTGTLGDGILLSHVLIAITKSSSESLTIDWELTIT